MMTKEQLDKFEKLAQPMIDWLNDIEDVDVEVHIDCVEARIMVNQLSYVDPEQKEFDNQFEEIMAKLEAAEMPEAEQSIKS